MNKETSVKEAIKKSVTGNRGYFRPENPTEKSRLENMVGGFFSPRKRDRHYTIEGDFYDRQRVYTVEITEEVPDSEAGLQYALARMKAREDSETESRINEINTKFGKVMQKIRLASFLDLETYNNAEDFAEALDTPGMRQIAVPGPDSPEQLKEMHYAPVVEIHARPTGDKPKEGVVTIRPRLKGVEDSYHDESGYFAVAQREGDITNYTVFLSRTKAKNFPTKKALGSVSRFIHQLATDSHQILEVEPLRGQREMYQERLRTTL